MIPIPRGLVPAVTALLAVGAEAPAEQPHVRGTTPPAAAAPATSPDTTAPLRLGRAYPAPVPPPVVNRPNPSVYVAIVPPSGASFARRRFPGRGMTGQGATPMTNGAGTPP